MKKVEKKEVTKKASKKTKEAVDVAKKITKKAEKVSKKEVEPKKITEKVVKTPKKATKILKKDESESKELKKIKKSNAVEPKKVKKKVVEESPKDEKTSKNNKIITTKGYKSRDILAELDAHLSPDEYLRALKRQLEWHAIGGKNDKKIKNDPGDILWGKVVGIKPYDNIKNKFYIIVEFNDVEIVIPEEWYFPKNYKFGLRYLDLKDEDKFAWRKLIVRSSLGSWVPFKITKVYEKQLDDIFEKQTVLWCLGNRLLALETLQDIFFFHKNRNPKTDGEPQEVVVGSKVEAHIISVREDLVFVEVCGVECRMDSINLSNKFVNSCRDLYKPGDVTAVWVKEIKTNEFGELQLVVTGRNNEACNKQIALMTVGSIYMGTTVRYSPTSGYYTFALANDVRAIVHENNVQGGIKLNHGDVASVHITEILPTHVIGNAIKIR